MENKIVPANAGKNNEEKKSGRGRGHKKPQHNPENRAAAYKADPAYMEAGEGMLEEFQRCGVPVHRDRIGHPEGSSLTVMDNLLFTRRRPQTITLVVDHEWGKAAVEAGNKQVSWNAEEKQYTVSFEIREELTFLPNDKYRTSVRPASIRFAPDYGSGNERLFPRVVLRRYFSYHHRLKQVVCQAHALPLYSTLGDLRPSEYAAPGDDASPVVMGVTFYPVVTQEEDGEVVPTAVHHSGKRLQWDTALEFDPANYGREIQVQLHMEFRMFVVCSPYSAALQQLHAAQAAQGQGGLTAAPEQLELKDDEFQYGNRALKIHEVLKEHGVEPDMSLRELQKARKKFMQTYHPDQDPVLRKLRDKGRDPGNARLFRGNVFTRGNAAFTRLLFLLNAKADEGKQETAAAADADAAPAENAPQQ